MAFIIYNSVGDSFPHDWSKPFTNSVAVQSHPKDDTVQFMITIKDFKKNINKARTQYFYTDQGVFEFTFKPVDIREGAWSPFPEADKKETSINLGHM